MKKLLEILGTITMASGGIAGGALPIVLIQYKIK